MKTALLVIDVQESFRQRPYFRDEPAKSFLARINALIDGCKSRGIPIVRILHIEPPAPADNPFALESGHVRPLKGLAEFDADVQFYKSRHSALSARACQCGCANVASTDSSSLVSAPNNAARRQRAMRAMKALKWTTWPTPCSPST